MNSYSRITRFSMAAAVAALMVNLNLTPCTYAKGGATDPIPGTSKSGGGGGGGGGGSTAPQPIISATLTFSASGPINGVLPVCTGSYRIDPYYPTLSLLTVNVSASSVNLPDGTPLYLNVVAAGGTLYPFTSNAILISAQAGSCTLSVYVTPGTTVSGVLITDASGNIVFAGN